MKKNILLISIVLMLSISMAVAANEITVNPTNISLITLRNINSHFNLTIFNNIQYNISNFAINNQGLPFSLSVPSISTIGLGGILNLNLVASCINRGDFITNVPITANYMRTAGFSNHTTYRITINENASVDTYSLNILKGDTVIWKNNWVAQVKIFISGMSEQTINPGAEFTHTFDEAGSFSYTFYPSAIAGGSINVQNSINILISNSFGLHLICLEPNSTIIMEVLEPANKNFNISYNDWGQAAIKISNTGSSAAVGLKYNMPWAQFTSQPDIIEANSFRIVVFSVIPEITATDQTDKNYIKTLTINGDNIVPISTDFNIFIPYSQVSLEGGNISSPDWWIQRMAFCNRFPTSPDCLTAPILVYQNRTIYQCPPTEANFTPQEVKDQIMQCSQLKESWNKIADIFKSKTDSMDTHLGNLDSSYNQTATSQSKIDKVVSNLFNAAFYVGCIIVVALIIGIIIFAAIKLKKYRNSKTHKTW